MDLEEQLFALWLVPPQEHGDAEAAFRRVYADPVVINGTPMPVAGLVARAAAVHATFTEHDIEIVDVVRGARQADRRVPASRAAHRAVADAAR